MEEPHSFIVLFNGKFIRVYNKSDMDEVLRHSKFKRCLVNAEMALSKYYFYCTQYYTNGVKRMQKWRHRWLELAKKFNPNNSTAQ